MRRLLVSLSLLLPFVAMPASAMHIMEGFLPAQWCVIWYLAALPFVFMSFRFISKSIKKDPKSRIKLAFSAAYIFILSALKLPSVTGSSSHLTGTSFGALTFGPRSIPLLGAIVLLFQALLLAHGGITTLGANIFSMAIVGPWIAYWIFMLLKKMKASDTVSIFTATFLGSLSTYVCTSIQLAIAFPDPVGGFFASVTKFLSIFAITQVPLSIIEGVLTVLVIRLLSGYKAFHLITKKPIQDIKA
ncbi:energy-coupling factor ABC transporter permease [Porphyromonadaceae bacterium W3.11]|nr:energy-coupling factor ABC transporter permease [Porphyromonadaceae bacterium W3.11]